MTVRKLSSIESIRTATSHSAVRRGDPSQFEASVVIITFNRTQSLMRTLDALAAQDAKSFEVIVVSDGSTDGTDGDVVVRTADFPVPLRLVRQDHAGVAAARNRGVSEAGSEVVVFTDDDCIPHSDWLRLLVQALQSDKGLGGVGGRTQIAPSGKIIPDYYEAYAQTTTPGMAHGHVLYLATCNAAFRRSALIDAGGFDSHQVPTGEDDAVSIAVREQGWRLDFEPKAVLDHYRPSSMRSFLRTYFAYGRGEMVRLRFDPLLVKVLRLLWRSRKFLLWLLLPFYWVKESPHCRGRARNVVLFPVLERLRQAALVAGQWRECRYAFSVFRRIDTSSPPTAYSSCKGGQPLHDRKDPTTPGVE